MRQVQGHCEYVDRNAKLDDGRAKCGEIHQQFRLKDMMDDKHIGDLRALETIQVSTPLANCALLAGVSHVVLCARACRSTRTRACAWPSGGWCWRRRRRTYSPAPSAACSSSTIWCATKHLSGSGLRRSQGIPCGQVIVADRKQELLSRRHYLRFRDKLDLDPPPKIVRRKAPTTQRSLAAHKICLRVVDTTILWIVCWLGGRQNLASLSPSPIATTR